MRSEFILVAALVMMYATNMHNYAFEEGLWPVKPVFIYLMTVAAVLWLVSRQEAPLFFEMLPQSVAFWIVIFIVLLIVAFIASSQSALVFRLTIGYVKFAFLFGLMTILMHKGSWRHSAEYALLCAALIAVVWYGIEIMNYADQVNGRARGAYKNPNYAGRMLIFCMLVSVTVVPRHLRFPFVLVCGLGVLFTFSRSSILLWGASVGGLFLVGMFGRISMLKVGLGAVCAVLAGAVVLGAAGGIIENSFLVEYLDKGTRERVGIDGSTFSDWSFDGRVRAAALAFDRFASSPWVGYGLGTTREWSMAIAPHNTYLMVGAEGGLLALLVYLAFIYVCWRSADDLGKIIVGLYAVSGVITHNNLDQLPNVIFLAYAARRGLQFRPHQLRPRTQLPA